MVMGFHREENGVVIRSRGTENIGVSSCEGREKGDIDQKSVQAFHNVACSQPSIAPCVFSVFWNDVHHFMLLHYFLQVTSEGIVHEVASSFFIRMED